MPFSSVLGASSVIKPGVCTSTTRPTVPYEGQLIYETDTDKVAAWNGSAWVYTHSSGLVLVKTQTIGTAVSSVTITDAFSSTYDNYLITVSGGTGNGSAVRMTFGSTSTGYYGGGLYISNAGTVTGYGDNNAARFAKILHETDGQGYGLSIQVLNPYLARRTIIVATGSPAGSGTFFSGGIANDTSYTSFTLDTVGTLTGGTIRVYGLVNT